VKEEEKKKGMHTRRESKEDVRGRGKGKGWEH
jgi:hypothetical protein